MTGRFHPDARSEAREAADAYDLEREGLGGELTDEIDRGLSAITAYPESAPLIERPLRKKVLRRFPYNLLYIVDDEGIFIVAVAHHKRRPGYWKSRLV